MYSHNSHRLHYTTLKKIIVTIIIRVAVYISKQNKRFVYRGTFSYVHIADRLPTLLLTQGGSQVHKFTYMT